MARFSSIGDEDLHFNHHLGRHRQWLNSTRICQQNRRNAESSTTEKYVKKYTSFSSAANESSTLLTGWMYYIESWKAH